MTVVTMPADIDEFGSVARITGSTRLLVQGPGGHHEVLEISGEPRTRAIRRVVSLGYRVISIESTAAAAAPRGNRARFPLMLFTQELMALLDAGLNLNEAVTTLLLKERQPAVRVVLEKIAGLLREGRSFSDVLASLPDHFLPIYIATVRASERTGGLVDALTRYAAYQLQFDALRAKLRTAAIYPAFLFGVGGCVALFLLGYVVPRFSAVFVSSGRDMPWLSGVLMAFGLFISRNWLLVLLLTLCVGVVLVVAASNPRIRSVLLRTILRMPWISGKAAEFHLARYYRAVSLLLSAGVALPRAMKMASSLLAPKQQVALELSRSAVEQGLSLSSALVSRGLAGPVAESLIKVGERSGRLSDMLERTARFQDEDLARSVDRASRLLEPALMALIGLVIGVVVVLLYMPIFDLAGSLR